MMAWLELPWRSFKEVLIGLLVLSPFLWMQSSRAIFIMYLLYQIYVGFVAPFISYNKEKFKRDERCSRIGLWDSCVVLEYMHLWT